MIILASKSPRRKELLSLITTEFEIIPAEGEERADRSLPPQQYVCELARHKAEEIAASHPGDIVIGADTVVVTDGEVLGKPKDEADAKRMLGMLSGREHLVCTGVCIISRDKNTCFCEDTAVRFFPLTNAEIDEYTASGEPFDKAGAYGIQEWIGKVAVEGINGSFYNVVGLPVQRLYRELKKV